MENLTSEDVKKIALVSQPRDWLSIISNLIGLIVIPGFVILFSYYQYHQLLPLQEAEVIFSQTDIQIIPNNTTNLSSEKGDATFLSLTNIGRATAKNISFHVYELPFHNPNVVDVYRDQIIQDLDPGEKITLGGFQLGYKQSSGLDLSPLKGKEQVAILIHLRYEDTTSQGEKDNLFLYQYILGTNVIGALGQNDYANIHDTLLKGIPSSSDQFVHQYLLNKPVEEVKFD